MRDTLLDQPLMESLPHSEPGEDSVSVVWLIIGIEVKAIHNGFPVYIVHISQMGCIINLVAGFRLLTQQERIGGSTSTGRDNLPLATMSIGMEVMIDGHLAAEHRRFQSLQDLFGCHSSLVLPV